MATTVSAIQSKTNQYFHGDTSTNSVSAADRLSAITEGVRELYNEFPFDFSNRSLTIAYYDTVNEYDITTSAPDFGEPTDLRLGVGDRLIPFTRKNPRELVVEIDEDFGEDAFTTEIRDRKRYLIINHQSKYSVNVVHECESLTVDGTWAADTSTSDATNLTLDEIEFKQGIASFNFDVTAAQSGNNRATLSNSTMTSKDFSDLENLAVFLFWVYIPDVTNFSSITFYIGSSSSSYWSGTATTDVSGAAFANGWNRIKVVWSAMTPTSSPDSTAIVYSRVDYNYTGSQTNATDFRLDDILVVRPENLTLLYESAYIGTSNSGTALNAFTATSDIPYYSGIYDYFDEFVSHHAAAVLFRQVRLFDDANIEEGLAQREMTRLKRKFPSSRIKETNSFKVKGINFSR